jgi:hypothetical protein
MAPTRRFTTFWIFTGLLYAGAAAADCHHGGKAYPEGGIVCEAGHEFRCGAMGVWHPLGTQCTAKADPEQSHSPLQQRQNPPGNETGSKGQDKSQDQDKPEAEKAEGEDKASKGGA